MKLIVEGENIEDITIELLDHDSNDIIITQLHSEIIIEQCQIGKIIEHLTHLREAS